MLLDHSDLPHSGADLLGCRVAKISAGFVSENGQSLNNVGMLIGDIWLGGWVREFLISGIPDFDSSLGRPVQIMVVLSRHVFRQPHRFARMTQQHFAERW